MFTVKNIEPGILEVQQKIHGWTSTEVVAFYYVRLDGKWMRVHNDSLETAQHAVAGTLTDLEEYHVRELVGDVLSWFKRYTLKALKGEFR